MSTIYLRRRAISSIAIALFLFGLITCGCSIKAVGQENAADRKASLPISLRHDQLSESSGLAYSHRRADRIWTHNDSGDSARIFAFDLAGKATGEYRLEGIEAIDWEDMASFLVDGRPRLLVADVGDNRRQRPSVALHLFDEPDPDGQGRLSHVQTIVFRYPEGPQDCEAVAVDSGKAQVLLATKELLPTARLYSLPLNGRAKSDRAEGSDVGGTPIEAELLARLPMPAVTAMDLETETGKLLLCGYFDLFIYRRSDAMTPWPALLATRAAHQRLPVLPQIEAACFGPQGRVWVSSEGAPAKLVRLPAVTWPPDPQASPPRFPPEK